MYFKLTERIKIPRSHPSFHEIDELSFKCKNLRNSVLYHLRQIRFRNEEMKSQGRTDFESYPSKYDLSKMFQTMDVYKDVGYMKTSQMVVHLAYQEYDNFRKAENDYFKNPSKYKAKPRCPYYKDSETGRFVVEIPKQAFLKLFYDIGFLKMRFISKPFKFRKMFDEGVNVKMAKFVPTDTGYDMLIIYDYTKEVNIPCDSNGETFQAGMDLGKNILSAIVMANGKGRLVNGKPLVHINNAYNQLIDKAMSLLPKGVYTSKKIKHLHKRRIDKINDFMHKASRHVIDLLEKEGVSDLFIGHNEGWKQEIDIGKKNNRSFVEIPFNKFIHMLSYKGSMNGIEVKTTEEAYTSKASSIDRDQLFKFGEREQASKYNFSGSRKQRGLYVSGDGHHANADANGAFNILRKCNPMVDELKNFNAVVMGCVVRPEYVRFDV